MGTIDSMPELVQEWYHAVGTPMGLGNFPWARECVKKGVDANARLDAYGGTALFLAIEQCNWEMVRFLVEEVKVDLELVDYGGYNALDYAAACHCHHPDKPPVLPDGSAAPMDIGTYLKTQGMQHTWLGAALAEDIDRLWEYLENGQDVNERGGHFNKTAMEEALDNGGSPRRSPTNMCAYFWHCTIQACRAVLALIQYCVVPVRMVISAFRDGTSTVSPPPLSRM